MLCRRSSIDSKPNTLTFILSDFWHFVRKETMPVNARFLNAGMQGRRLAL